jgi:AAA+ superfamily predicted ATPase
MSDWQLIERLDALLADAVRTLAPSEAAESPGPLRDLYLDADQLLTLLEPDAASPFNGRDPEAVEPGWSAILSRRPDLSGLRSMYGLSDFELDVLLLALAPEFDLRYEPVFGYLHRDPTQRQPTLQLVLTVLARSRDERLARRATFDADAPLLRQNLVRLVPNNRVVAAPLLSRVIVVDEQIVDVVLQQNGLDRRLRQFCTLTAPSRDIDDTVEAITMPPTDAMARAGGVTLYFHGLAGSGRLAAARGVAAARDAPLLVARVDSMASTDDTFDTALLSTLFREARLHGAVLYLDSFDELWDALSVAGRLRVAEYLSARDDLTILAGTRPWVHPPETALGVVTIRFETPGADVRRQAWELALGPNNRTCVDEHQLDALASRFRLTSRQIGDAVLTARNTAAVRHGAGDAAIDGDDLFAAARAQSGHELSSVARKITPLYGWDDIVLPAEPLEQLREVCLRVVHRNRVMTDWGFDAAISQGKGITALFAGPPGTGKTMAAEVISRDLELDLYAIDLAAVVSKYIGETEKNLDRIFTAASTANAILFFDEADALFGKRSAVNDAHDRYANVEIAYLLQRMEQYDGLAILATNLRENLDDAFTRRLHFIVEFPLPTADDRRRIWRARIPSKAPLDPDIDLDYLAESFRLTGANIANAVLSAAFRAAAEDSSIGMDHLLAAVLREYQKIGQVPPADMQWQAATTADEMTPTSVENTKQR